MTEGTFSNETQEKLAKIQRFGVGGKDRDEGGQSCSAEEAFRLAKEKLKESGFLYPKQRGENEAWLYFASRAKFERTQRLWSGFDKQERKIIEEEKEVPWEMRQAYKVCIDVPVSELWKVIDILSSDFEGISFTGKIGRQRVLGKENFPKIVLYVAGADLSEALDFALNLAVSVKNKIGLVDSKLRWAKEIEENSGVFLTQGNFEVKEWAEKEGKFSQYYGSDGALFKKTEDEYSVRRLRRENQVTIEESLYDFVGIKPFSERLILLQERAFEGVEGAELGIRKRDVRIGKSFFPPHFYELPALIKLCDSKTGELKGNNKIEKDFSLACRAMAVIQTFYFLVHPLRDGNGQSCMNLISSLLFEAGYQRVFFRTFLDGRELRIKALPELLGITEPTIDVLSGKAKNEGKVEGEHSHTFPGEFIGILTNRPWEKVKQYVETGRCGLEGKEKKELSEDDRILVSFIKRVADVSNYLNFCLKDAPTGSSRLSLGEQQKAVGEAMKIIGKKDE